MDIAKQLDRARYMAREPGNFLRLAGAILSNKYLGLTMNWGTPTRHCNICGFSGRKFYYFLERSSVKADVQCPVCGSMPRNRMMLDFLINSLELAGAKMLDVAPVKGYRKKIEAAGAEYHSIDYGSREVSARMDLTRLAFADGAFDVVLCSHVLEHILDYRTALAEINRILKNNATAIIDIPFDQTSRSLVLESPDHQGHWHVFGQDFKDKLLDCGFEVETKYYRDDSPKDDPSNVFFLCRKK